MGARTFPKTSIREQAKEDPIQKKNPPIGWFDSPILLEEETIILQFLKLTLVSIEEREAESVLKNF